MAAVQWIAARDASSQGPSVTQLLHPSTGNPFADSSNALRRQISAGVWSNLSIVITTNTLSAAATFSSKVNGAGGNQTMSIGAGATGRFTDTTNTDTIAANTDLEYSLATAAGGTAIVRTVMSSVFNATTDSLQVYGACQGADTTLNGVTRYNALSGNITGDSTVNQTEASCQLTMRSTATFQKYTVRVRTNTKGGNSFAKFRKNGANGNGSITIGAGVTGLLSDTSNTDSVVSGDLVCWGRDYYADGNNLRFWSMDMECVSTTQTQPILAADNAAAPVTVALSSTVYSTAGNGNTSTTESERRTLMVAASVLSFLQAYVITNTLTGNTTFKSRKNGAAGNQTVTFGTAATGWGVDSSNTDSLSAGDDFTWETATPGAGTSIIYNNLSMTVAPPSTGTSVRDLIGMGIIPFAR